MIGRTLLLAIAIAAPAAAQTAPDAEIVVTGQIERISLSLGRDAEGRTTCGLNRSSGDAAIDQAMCRRAARCVKRGPIDAGAIDACIAKQKKALTAAWLRGERS